MNNNYIDVYAAYMTGMKSYFYVVNGKLITSVSYACPLQFEKINMKLFQEHYQAGIDRMMTIPGSFEIADIARNMTIPVIKYDQKHFACAFDGYSFIRNDNDIYVNNALLCRMEELELDRRDLNGIALQNRYRIVFLAEQYIGLALLLYIC